MAQGRHNLRQGWREHLPQAKRISLEARRRWADIGCAAGTLPSGVGRNKSLSVSWLRRIAGERGGLLFSDRPSLRHLRRNADRHGTGEGTLTNRRIGALCRRLIGVGRVGLFNSNWFLVLGPSGRVRGSDFSTSGAGWHASCNRTAYSTAGRRRKASGAGLDSAIFRARADGRI